MTSAPKYSVAVWFSGERDAFKGSLQEYETAIECSDAYELGYETIDCVDALLDQPEKDHWTVEVHVTGAGRIDTYRRNQDGSLYLLRRVSQ